MWGCPAEVEAIRSGRNWPRLRRRQIRALSRTEVEEAIQAATADMPRERASH